MSIRQVRQRCERLLKDVSVPDPFDAETFRDVVANRRGRPIRMIPREQMAGPCGVLVSMTHTDYVFFDSATSPVHRDHIVAHELGHLLCDHVPRQRVGEDLIRTLMPDLDPAMVRRVLARTTYDDVDELEAEIVASLVLAPRRGQRPDGTGNAVIDRLQRSLGATGA